MDEFTVEIPGVKPIKLKAHFATTCMDLGARNQYDYGLAQVVTTCIIRKGNLTVGTGVAISHPLDLFDNNIGHRVAFKVAAKAAIWGLFTNDTTLDDMCVKDFNDLWKNIYSGWRKSRRAQAEAEAVGE